MTESFLKERQKDGAKREKKQLSVPWQKKVDSAKDRRTQSLRTDDQRDDLYSFTTVHGDEEHRGLDESRGVESEGGLCLSLQKWRGAWRPKKRLMVAT